MSGATPGQAMHDSLRDSAPDAFGRPASDFATWDQLPAEKQERMEAAAQAAIAAQQPQPAPLWPDGAPVRDADGEPQASPELAAAKPDPAAAWRLLEETRNSVAGIAEGLERRAEINRPSKVSEVCDGIAADLRKALS